MNVRKRGLALLMCICMIFTLLPFSALADATTQDVVYGKYDNDGNWQKDNNLNDTAPYPLSDGNKLELTKKATKTADNTYRIDLKVVMTQTTSTTPPGSAATVLVIDTSSSMADDNKLVDAKKAAISFLEKYKGDTANTHRYVSVVSFNDTASVTINWKDVSVPANYTAVVNAINGLRANGGTNLDQALFQAKAQFSAVTVKDIPASAKNVIALTDGCPTYYGDGIDKHGSYGCPETNKETEKTATALKTVAGVYTVCFGAANEKCWTKDSAHRWIDYFFWIDVKEKHPTDGPKVGDFLKDSIATSASHAYNADNTTELMDAFKAITNTIVSGLNSGVVTDPMGDNVSLVGTAPSGFATNDNGRTYTWELSGAPGVTNGDKTTYTYEKSYTVKLDTSGDDEYHPLNGRTTFTAGGKTYDFNVPGVYREAKYTVTYQYTGDAPEGAPLPSDNTQYKKGDPVTVKDAPTLDGYTFSGWTPTTESNVTIENGKFEMPANNVVLEGSWTKLEGYTVKYMWGDTVLDTKAGAALAVGMNTPNESPKSIEGYTPKSNNSISITISTDPNKNVIIFEYYKNVTLTANSKTVTYNGEEQIVSGFTGAPEGADFSAIEVGAKGTQPNTYPANFDEVTKGTVDATGKYIVTDVVNGNLVIEAAYQVHYEYKNAPADAPACPTDDTYYADNTTVTLQQPGTAPTGYKFVGWKVDGTGDVVTEVTINGANVRLVGEWEPVTGLSYVVHYYWVGTEDKVAPDKIVDKQTFGTVITSETPIQVPNYKALPDQVSNLKISTENEMNVITFYYYKNVELTSNSGNEKYDGTLKTVDGFKAIVAADNGADIYESLKEVLAAHGQGTDAGRYDVYFTKGGEIIPATDLVGRVLNDRYWVTKAEQGKLIISPRSLTITSGSDSKYYDGTPLTNDKITVTGDGFVNGEGATYNVTGSQTKIGSSDNTFEVIFNANTKAANYVVEKELGTLTIKARPVNPGIYTEIIVEITGNSDSVVYDGTEHSVKGYTVKISDPRYTEADFTFTGKAEASGVNAGTYEMGLKAEQFKNTNARFTNVKFVIKADGVLTITPKELTITAGSKTEYGPTPVTCGEWTVSGLVAGDKDESVKITGIQSVPGSSPNVPSDAVIKNAKGEDVTKNYAIKYVNGTLTMLEVLNKEDHFNYIIGTPEGLSLPTANVTRAEVATIFFRLMTDDARAKFDSLDNNFSDVAKGKWYNRAISTLAKAGIIKGDPAGTYRPGDPITRAEMAAIIARFGDFKEGGKTFNDISGHWAQKYIELAASNGWINGNPDGTFKPNNKITRAETVAMINRVLDRQTKDVSDLLPVSQMTNWSDNMDTAKWYYRDMQEATNNHKAERVGNSIYEKWTEKLPDIDWASYQI